MIRSFLLTFRLALLTASFLSVPVFAQDSGEEGQDEARGDTILVYGSGKERNSAAT